MQDRLHRIDTAELLPQRLFAKKIDIVPGAKGAGHGDERNSTLRTAEKAAVAASGSRTTSKFFTKNQSIFASSHFA
jgi:hypothetical protein